MVLHSLEFMGGNLDIAQWGFPSPHLLRPIILLRGGIAVLSLVVGLVPLCARAAGGRTTHGEGDGAAVVLEREGARGTETEKTGRDTGPSEASSVEIHFSSVQDGDALRGGLPVKTAVFERRSGANKRGILLATSIAVMLAILGSAAHRSRRVTGLKSHLGHVAERIKKLMSLESEAAGLAGAVASAESRSCLRFFKDAIASAEEAKAAAAASTAAKEVPKLRLQENIDIHLADSISSLRFLLKSAGDRAQLLWKEAKEVVQRSVSRPGLGEAELGWLDDELTEAYVIIRKALETSIPALAGNAEQAVKSLEKLPPLRCEDDGHLLNQTRGYINFINSRAFACDLAEKYVSQIDSYLVDSHRRYYVHEKVISYYGIEKLLTFMKAHVATAARALLQKDSALPNDTNRALHELVEAVRDLEKQFNVVKAWFSRLTLSYSTADTVEASTKVTAETNEFLKLHEVCVVKLQQTRHFFDSSETSCEKGCIVLKSAMDSIRLESHEEYDGMQKSLDAMREKAKSMADGTAGEFRKPLVSAEIIQRLIGQNEALEQLIKDAKGAMLAAAQDNEKGSFKEDLELLERVHSARVNMVGLRRQVDEYSALFRMLLMLQVDIESSIDVYEGGQLRLEGERTASRLEEVAALSEQFRVGVDAARNATTLPEVARAANALRSLADKIFAAIFEPTKE